jgi:transcriptional regulator with XRE-family HTH domain
MSKRLAVLPHSRTTISPNGGPQKFRGINLVALREERGLSQTAVSKRAGISRSALANTESGRSIPTIETLLKLANSMRLPLSKFLSSVGLLRR